MTKEEIEKTEWAEVVSLLSPTISQEAIELAANNPEVLIFKTDETGEKRFAIAPVKDPTFWFDSFKFKKDAVKLCKEMRWKIRKSK